MNPTPEIHKAISEAKTIGRGIFSSNFPTNLHKLVKLSHILQHISFYSHHLFPLSTDADKQPANSLSKIAAFIMEDLLLETSESTKGAINNVC